MRIEMRTKIEGTRNGVRWPAAGTVVDLPDGEALDLLSQGLAVPVTEDRTEKRPAAKRAEKRG